VNIAGLEWVLPLLTQSGIRPSQIWVFGQDPTCQIHIADEYVSGFHALAVRDQAGVMWLADLGSTNGTWHRTAGGVFTQVHGPTRLRPGDTVKVGRTELPWTANHERNQP
jgi:pSer/pThr/pTyr-binding forkhead associated (FHA) protein